MFEQNESYQDNYPQLIQEDHTGNHPDQDLYAIQRQKALEWMGANWCLHKRNSVKKPVGDLSGIMQHLVIPSSRSAILQSKVEQVRARNLGNH